MRAIDRKLLRDAWHYRSQLGVIATVVTCGIALFVTLRSMNGYLRGSRDRYYREYRFADVFAPLKRAPLGAARVAQASVGVRAVEARLTFDVTLDVPGLVEPAIGRLVSVPVPRRPGLNELHLQRGRWPERHLAEVIASGAFARANRLSLGDSLGAVMHGRWQWLRIVGIAISPEYVYEIGSAGIFPDNRRFGVLWMSYDALADAFDMRGAFNHLSLALAPGASERGVMDSIDRLLAPYGGFGAFGRRTHVSAAFLEGEIEETQITSVFLPGIFLGVTAFLLHLVLSRLIGTQREQIATLKAFGYSNISIGAHYLELALVPVVLGCSLGTALGLWLAELLATVYAQFYQFPSVEFVPDWRIVWAAVAVGVAAGLLGALGSVRRSVRLPPAEAMRPEAPTRFRAGLLESLRAFQRLGPATRVVARNMQRRPGKVLLSALGLAFAVGMVVTVLAMYDAIDLMKEVQFFRVSREDARVTFESPRRAAAVAQLAQLPGVLSAEPLRVVPVRLQFRQRRYQTTIIALSERGELRRIIDEHGSEHRAPRAGLLVSQLLARVLAVRPGDLVIVDVLEGKRERRLLPVAGTVAELLGTAAYMDAAALGDLLGDGDVVSGAFLSIDPRVADAVYGRLKRLPAVAGVEVREAALRGFERTIAESFSISLFTMMLFACVIAFGIVYNGARVALSERGRELASLRVLGFTRQEVTTMLLGEQAILTMLAIPMGFAIAYGLCSLLSWRFESELFRFPVVVNVQSYLIGAVVVIASGLLSGLAVRGRVRRLDLVAVLKTRE
ncbi:MAG TPA: ABC transporter permease [Gemmatimonadaceae bacterium]|jgi:putative ABC transport system permease protein